MRTWTHIAQDVPQPSSLRVPTGAKSVSRCGHCLKTRSRSCYRSSFFAKNKEQQVDLREIAHAIGMPNYAIKSKGGEV